MSLYSSEKLPVHSAIQIFVHPNAHTSAQGLVYAMTAFLEADSFKVAESSVELRLVQYK
jgi:hypothetical protein